MGLSSQAGSSTPSSAAPERINCAKGEGLLWKERARSRNPGRGPEGLSRWVIAMGHGQGPAASHRAVLPQTALKACGRSERSAPVPGQPEPGTGTEGLSRCPDSLTPTCPGPEHPNRAKSSDLCPSAKAPARAVAASLSGAGFKMKNCSEGEKWSWGKVGGKGFLQGKSQPETAGHPAIPQVTP